MRQLLIELYQHQEWADMLHWAAFEQYPRALGDGEIRKRLYHLHMTQYAFYCITSGEKFAFRQPEEFADIMTLKNFAIDTHNLFRHLLSKVTEPGLEEILNIPWFKEPPLMISRRNALVQAVYHSQYHRGQNAMRMRELGGEPPMTDYIAWLWKGRPGV